MPLTQPVGAAGEPQHTLAPPAGAGRHGRTERQIEIVSGTAIGPHPGRRVPIGYVLGRDCKDEFRPQAFLCADLTADPLDILRWFIRRWRTGVTFAETQRHLGGETQRQGSDQAIARTTPARLVLPRRALGPSASPRRARLATPRKLVFQARWYSKTLPTFADALATVRRTLWQSMISDMSPNVPDTVKIPRAVLNHLTNLACYPA